MGRLDGRVAVVTGAAQGIGAATALRLAQDGADVVLVDVREGACEQSAEAVRATGRAALAVTCDVTSAEQVRAMAEQALERFARVDILVNNAGITRDSLLFKMTEDQWDLVLAVHLRGAFLCSRALQGTMVERKAGRILNLSSVSALGNRGQANYSAAKAGLQGLTRTLAIELGPFGITVNAVAPGFIDTEMTRATARQLGLTPEQLQAAAAQNIPLRRVGQPEEVASVLAFLASDDASYVNGQILYVAGGPAGTGL